MANKPRKNPQFISCKHIQQNFIHHIFILIFIFSKCFFVFETDLIFFSFFRFNLFLLVRILKRLIAIKLTHEENQVLNPMHLEVTVILFHVGFGVHKEKSGKV